MLLSPVSVTACSIRKWIITKSCMWSDGPVVYEATFTTIQSARGKKSAEQRWGNHSTKSAVTALIEEGHHA
ncbi:hypothetical protein FHE74_10540 [Corynebacterium tapiri]|uniref:Uncharacterized protein n=1 Tax=Corynebacterium tapiri TaxID=1448266 RepID=A0A5C4U118_9CORY|nr:hypothetical protein FHE74_10540 [Corynebacterium tapiri]